MKYTEVNEEAKREFWRMIEESDNILITSHVSPDEDSIASVLAMYTFINRKFVDKKVRIAYSNQAVERFVSFRYYDKIEFLSDITEIESEFDLVILLDCNEWSRASDKIDKHSILKSVCIDHHKSIPDIHALSIIDTTSPACAELVYNLGNQADLDLELAEAILLGILGDTGNFVYLKPEQSKTFDIAKRLVGEFNINIQRLESRYRYITATVFDIIKEFIKNHRNAEIEGYAPFSYSYISREVVEENNWSDVDINSGKSIFISSYIRNVYGYPWGFTIIPKGDKSRLSSRSLPTGENVRMILEKMGIGSGHDLASGGRLDIANPEEAVRFVLDWLRNNKKQNQ